MAYEGYVTLGGSELVNNARAAAYGASVGVSCVCGDLAASLGDDPYTSPKQDKAPWYDPGEPASAEFWGLVGLEITGADSATAERQWTELLGDGGVPGAERDASREIEVKALAVAADAEALSYGLSWLSAALRGSACGDGCTGDALCVYTACPQPPTQRAGSCDEPAGAAVDHPDTGWSPELAGEYLIRALYDVARVEGPRVEARRTLAGGVVAEVSFVLKAGVPQWHRTPVRVADLHMSTLPADAYTTVLHNYSPIGVLDDCEAQQDNTDCLADNPYCTLPPFPTEPVLDLADPCYPTGTFHAAQLIYTIPPDTNPEWLTKVPVVTVRSGSLPLHRLTVRWYDNPLHLACQGPVEPCLACSEITLPWMPRHSTLMLDGRMSRAELDCPGGSTDAAHTLYGPRGGLFTWPEFDCQTAMCLEILFDASNYARDVQVQVDVVTREDSA